MTLLDEQNIVFRNEQNILIEQLERQEESQWPEVVTSGSGKSHTSGVLPFLGRRGRPTEFNGAACPKVPDPASLRASFRS